MTDENAYYSTVGGPARRASVTIAVGAISVSCRTYLQEIRGKHNPEASENVPPEPKSRLKCRTGILIVR